MSDDSAGLIQQLLGELNAARKEAQTYKHSWAAAKMLLKKTEERLLTSHNEGYKQGYAAALPEIDALRNVNEKLTDELERLKK